jgi:hypothetical protein
MHQPPVLRPVVVKGGQVLHAAVIPHEEVMHLPGMRVAKLGLLNPRGHLLDERHRHRILHAGNGDTFPGTDIETFPPGNRMWAHDRVEHLRLLGPQSMIVLPGARARPAPGDPVHRVQALQARLERIIQMIIGIGRAGKVRRAEGPALVMRDLQSVEHGQPWWTSCIGHVGMPDTSRVGLANVATVFLDVGDEQDFPDSPGFRGKLLTYCYC